MSLDLTDDERSELAQEVAAELDTGQYGDKYVLSRRQLLTLATATGGGGVLAALGADGAAAQATDDTSSGTVRGNSGGGMDVYLDQLRDPTGDEVLNVDDTGAIDATLREWVFAAARAQSLGIENTGASLGEDSGDLVVKDSDGSVVLRYDSDTGSWEMDSLSTNTVDISDTILESGEFVDIQSAGVSENPSDTSSTSYEVVADSTGSFDLVSNPPGTAIYGRFVARIKNNTSSETTFARPLIGDSDGGFESLSELEISVSGDFKTVDSGWVEITSVSTDDIYVNTNIEAKVTGGTGSFSASLVGLLIGWRIE